MQSFTHAVTRPVGERVLSNQNGKEWFRIKKFSDLIHLPI